MKKLEASRLLKENKISLITDWEKEVRKKIKVAQGTYQSALVNTLPVFIENLADALDLHQATTLAIEGSSVAIDHGTERARLTAYTPEHIIQEYQILRSILCRFLREHEALDENIKELITLSIEGACMHSCRGFFETFLSLREHFMLTLSHDLRNPLSIAKSAAEYILKHPDDVRLVTTLGEKIERSLDRVDKMIQSLLDASRLRMGEKLNLNFAPMDLVQTIKEVIAEFSIKNGDRFKLEAPESVRGIWDPEAMKRVFENLLTNALKYGSPSAPITISIELLFDKTIIKVHNEGSYISLEDQKNLFTLFRQIKGRTFQSHKGWGIGLMLVKGVIEGHGGGVSINSHKDSGTSFILDLPMDGSKYA